MSTPRQPLFFTPVRLLLVTAVLLTGLLNSSFFRQLFQSYSWSQDAGFLLSSVPALLAVTLFAMALFSLLLPARLVASIFVCVAIPVAYFSEQMGTVFNDDMFLNLLSTDAAEAGDILPPALAMTLVLWAILPVGLIWISPYQPAPSLLSRTGRLLAVMLVSLTTAGGCFALFSADYITFIREHKPIRYHANPVYPIYSFGEYLVKSTRAPGNGSFTILTEQAHIPEEDNESELIVVVVGETARADHFSLNGYTQPTNPRLAQESRLVSFRHVSSCGTATAISVPCMFSFSRKSEFDVREASHTENVIDILNKAGVHILWRDNNSSSKGVADRVPYEDFREKARNPACDDEECRDVGMLAGLQQYIDHTPGDKLIVLHQMGSHGPAYYKRYPDEFEKFVPACHTPELGNCSRKEITNAYDNTILYTDYFLSQVIALLKANSENHETAMFYISDHGESLGEKGLYLHGLPYAFAPEAQTHIPLLIWVGENSDLDYGETRQQEQQYLTHDSFSINLLKAFEIETDLAEQSEGLPAMFSVKHEDGQIPGSNHHHL